jgi:F0F1-type ATP synthase delta subunit
MDEARQEVRQWKDQALERVKDEIEQSRQTWMEGLSLEKERTRSRIRKTLSEQVLIVSRKVLNDLADGSLERSAVEQFLRRLEQARNEQGESFDSTGEIHFELGFDSPEHQEMIRSRLSGIFGSREQVRAKINPELGFGIMVRAGDRKWDWNSPVICRISSGPFSTSFRPSLQGSGSERGGVGAHSGAGGAGARADPFRDHAPLHARGGGPAELHLRGCRLG